MPSLGFYKIHEDDLYHETVMRKKPEITMELVTTAEAVKLLDLCPDSVRQLARLGKLKYATVIGRRGMRLFVKGEVERLQRKRFFVEFACAPSHPWVWFFFSPPETLVILS